MKVPFVNLQVQAAAIRAEVEKQWADIITRCSFVCGKRVEAFEAQFAEAHGVRHAVGLSSGTAGNHLAMLLAGVEPGDEVLVPANTFIATAEGISLAGGTPVFVDVDEATFNMDARRIEERLTPRTRVINPVHLFGLPADMDALRAVAGKHDLKIVEDAAQAHLAEYKGRKVGGQSDVASWSFYPGKNLGAWGEAGAITTDDPRLYEKALLYRNHGSRKKYLHEMIGHNYRMEEIQAAVLTVKMNHLRKWTEQRRANARRYTERLRDLDAVIPPTEPPDGTHVYHLYVIRVPERREALMQHLAAQGIDTGLHYPIPLHLTQAYAHLKYKRGDFPVAERLAGEILSLPMFPELSEDQIDFVCAQIRAFFA
ncbi:MAG: DegT/DnrJ/EryC1/StrS family aminotransferase [Verrucomicrobia bacterium]|nr:DegT/DnrJ/EryC1/StrS family aminotransferase [Verrucomicrobiota bacterium]MBU1910134.1 DegT/DnrJ/EryC1/StrS family aminotransferase [Verrucomicrobiota bacterium]